MSTVTSTPDYSTLPAEAKDPVYYGLKASAWLKILVFTAALVALFRFNIARLWAKANPFTGTDWQHTFIIPVVGIYYLYLNSDRLLSSPVKPILLERITRNRLIGSVSAILAGVLVYFAGGPVVGAVFGNSDTFVAFAHAFGYAASAWGIMMLALGWGLGNLVFGLLVFAYGIWPGQNDWIKDYGMVHTIFGTVLTLCGWEIMKVAWFPIAFLICGIPWPGLVYSWIANPLQRLAALITVKTLNVTGITSGRFGTKMFITGSNGVPRLLNVAEACSGLRSLMTFISVAAAVAFLSQRAFWQKVVITLSAIPIAIFCNVLRVTGQAYIDRIAGEQWSENFAHQFVGLVMLIPAFFLILLVAWVLDHMFVEEVDDKARLKAAIAAKRATAPASTPGAVVEKKVIAVPPKTAPVAKTQPAAKPQAARPTTPPPPAAPQAKPAAPPAKPAAPAPPPARIPPRQNLTGKPAPRPAVPPPTAPKNKPAEGE